MKTRQQRESLSSQWRTSMWKFLIWEFWSAVHLYASGVRYEEATGIDKSRYILGIVNRRNRPK